VNAPLSVKELRRVRVSLDRGRPYGDGEWIKRTASELSLGHTIRPEGRPSSSKPNEPVVRMKNWLRPCFRVQAASRKSWSFG
jgi:hypothetical protein